MKPLRLAILLSGLALVHLASAATKTWDGSASGFWTNGANWTGNVAPVSGDDLVFPGGTSRLTTTNTTGAPNGFGSLTFTGTNYVLRIQPGASPLAFSGGISNNAALVTNTIDAPVTLSNNLNFFAATKGQLKFGQNIALNAHTVAIRGGSDVVLSGGFTGTGGLSLPDTADLFLDGNSAFSGPTTVNGGRLIVEGSLITSALTLNGGLLGGSGTVTTFNNVNGTVSPGTRDTVSSPDTLHVNGNATFSVGSVYQCDLATNAFDSLSVTGVVTLNNATLSPFVISTPAPNTVMPIIINDGADAVGGTFAGKPENTIFTAAANLYRISYTNGTGNDVTLTRLGTTGATSFWDGGPTGTGSAWSIPGNWVGDVVPPEGNLLAFTNTPLFTVVNNTLPSDRFYAGLRTGSDLRVVGNRLILSGTIASTLTGASEGLKLECPINALGTLVVSNLNNGVQNLILSRLDASNATLVSRSSVSNNATTLANLTGNGSLTHFGPGSLILTGTNDFTGPVTAAGGTVQIQTDPVNPFASGTISISNGATLLLSAPNFYPQPILLGGEISSPVGTNSLTGPVTLVGSNATLAAFLAGTRKTLAMKGVISGGPLTTRGTGIVALDATNDFTGPLNIGPNPADIITLVNAPQPALPVAVGFGVLGGNGVVGDVTMSNINSRLAPGVGVGTLSVSNLLLRGNLQVEINGPGAGVGYDQLVVRGSLNLASEPVLACTFGYRPDIGEAFTIISKTSPGQVFGPFHQLGEGALTTNGTVVCQITYAGGDGNDVVLTVVGYTSAGTSTWAGLGADAKWSTPSNWVGNVVPPAGADIVFPSGTPRTVALNDLTNTFAGHLSFGGPFTLIGNTLTLFNGIEGSNTTGLVSLDTPLLLADSQRFSSSTAGSSLRLTAPVTALTPCTLSNSVSGGSLSFSSLHGPATFVLENGVIAFGSSNSYSGGTVLRAGTLQLTGAGTLGAPAAPVTVLPGAALVQMRSGSFSNPLALQGQLNPGVADIVWAGEITVGGTNAQIFNSPPTPFRVSGNLAGAAPLACFGNLTLLSSNAYAGNLSCANGQVLVEGSLTAAAVTVNASATLGGTGAVGHVVVNAAGTLAPGDSPGRLTSINANLLPGALLVIEIAGTNAGNSYDQLRVNGTVTLGGSLVVSNTAQLTPGQQFVIIDNDGSDPVAGTFVGLPEGAKGTNGVFVWQISYVGGTGNDVVLTATGYAPAAATSTWTGLGANDNWSTPENWSGNLVPSLGAALTFPLGTPWLSPNNDLTNFIAGRLVFTGAYTINGNTFTLLDGIACSNATGNVTLNTSLLLGGGQRFARAGAATALVLNAPITATVPSALTNSTQGGGISFSSLHGPATFVLENSGFQFATSNSYSGGTVLLDGFLQVIGTGTLGVPGAPVTVLPPAALVPLRSGVFSNSIALQGTLNVSATDVTWAGDIAVGGTTATIVNNLATPLVLAGNLGGSAPLFCAGRTTLLASNDYSGSVAFSGSRLSVEGSLAAATISINTAATLGGTGVVGPVFVNAGGTIAPGNSAGRLTCGNLDLPGGGTFEVEISGNNAGGNYDQLRVHGTVKLGGALALSNGIPVPAGQTWVIIDNDGSDAVSGTFSGLPEGATVTLGGRLLQITYTGGDGNDVQLTSLPPAPTGVTRVWDGGGANNLWSTAANWVGDVVPQEADAVLFPLAGGGGPTINDIAGTLVLDRVDFESNSYSVTGNPLGLLRGASVRFSPGGGGVTLQIPLTLLGDAVFANVSNTVNLSLSAGPNPLDLGGHTLTLVAEQPITLGSPLVSASGGSMVKGGAGPAFIVSSNNSYAGPTVISNGVLYVRGNVPGLTRVRGGQFAGIGLADTVLVDPGAEFFPGEHLGTPNLFSDRTLSISNSLTLQPTARCRVGLRSAARFSRAAAPVIQLTGAELQVLIAQTFNEPLGTVFPVLENTGVNPVDGTFAGLPEGSVVTATTGTNTRSFRVSYVGGDGNDVTLTLMPPQAPPSTIQAITALAGGQIQIQGLGLPGLAYVLEAAPHLDAPIPWSALATNTANGSGDYLFLDPAATNFPMRFYRVRSP